MLHVTNGDIVVGMLAASGQAGDRLTWADVLHEGPVPAGLPDDELRRERARFLAVAGYEDALARMERRDRRLEQAAGREEIVLWFEADLYDQLQLLQILDRLDSGGVELICIGAHPSVERFYGLGQLESRELPPLFEQREKVTAEQIELARTAWAAFREPTPEALARVREDELSALPFLGAALTRLLEELPWTTDGLSRTDRSLLSPLETGPASAADLFLAHMAEEERPFLGDTWADQRLDELAAGERPLAVRADGLFTLTDDGRAVLAGKLDAIELRGIDRWLGGTHLRPGRVWRWDPEPGRVTG